MTGGEVLSALRAAGVTLEPDGDIVRMRSRAGPPPAHLLEEARLRKAELLALLRYEAFSPEVRWRADAMLLQRGEGALPVLVARLGLPCAAGACFSCGEALGAPAALGRLGRCEDCRQAAEWVCRGGSQ